MTRQSLQIGLALLLGVSVALGADKTARPAGNAPADDGEALRDPFWPVGFVPPRVKAAPAEDDSPLMFTEFSAEEQALIRKSTNVAGILKQRNGFYAIINNQVVRPGDVLNVALAHKRYRFYIRAISTERVVLDYIKPEEHAEPEAEKEDTRN